MSKYLTYSEGQWTIKKNINHVKCMKTCVAKGYSKFGTLHLFTNWLANHVNASKLNAMQVFESVRDNLSGHKKSLRYLRMHSTDLKKKKKS